jgi:hypothetical protein
LRFHRTHNELTNKRNQQNCALLEEGESVYGGVPTVAAVKLFSENLSSEASEGSGGPPSESPLTKPTKEGGL